jgi:hypothetical protein
VVSTLITGGCQYLWQVELRRDNKIYQLVHFIFLDSVTTPHLDGMMPGLDLTVKLRTMSIAPALIWRGDLSARMSTSLSYENVWWGGGHPIGSVIFLIKTLLIMATVLLDWISHIIMNSDSRSFSDRRNSPLFKCWIWTTGGNAMRMPILFQACPLIKSDSNGNLILANWKERISTHWKRF